MKKSIRKKMLKWQIKSGKRCRFPNCPIGTRIACACANLVMEWLWEQVLGMMEKSDSETNMEVHMKGNFVDDARILLNTLRKGTRFDSTKFTWSQEHEDEDKALTREDITYREIGRCLNSICGTLDFTLERHSDFPEN